jgi:hypothetical protein
MCVAYVGIWEGRQAAQKKEFSFLSFYHLFFLLGYTTTTKTLVKSDVTSARRKPLQYILLLSLPFAVFFSPVLTNACITFASRSGVVDIRSLFFYTEEKEADEKGKVAATAPIYT